MTRAITFELCAETFDACSAAREGGAHRIELCSALSEDGLTPSHALIRAAVEQSGLPVHVLLRPRAGDFVYSAAELALIREDLLHARNLGASGFVLGILNRNGTVDISRTAELVQLAGPLEVTFHRAFDATPAQDEALEAVIRTGCRRILTSGGKPDVVAGSPNLARLVKLAADRIDIAAGGGLRLESAASVARDTGASHFHGSIRRKTPRSQSSGEGLFSRGDDYTVHAEDIRAVIAALEQH